MSTAIRSPTTSASSIPQIFGFSCELSIVAGTADVFVDQAGPVGLGLFAVLAVVEDGCDRV